MMQDYNFCLLFSCILLCLSGLLEVRGATLDAIYAAAVSIWLWVVFDA